MAALSQLRDFLWPEHAERDPGFQAEIGRLSRRGLRVIGTLQIGLPLLSGLFYLVPLVPAWPTFSAVPLVGSILTGLITRWSADTGWGGRYARLVGIFSGFSSMALETWSELHFISIGLRHQMSGGLGALVVLLVGIAVLPLKPWHTFALGAGCSVIYLRWSAYAMQIGWIAPETGNDLVFTSFPLVVLMCTALTAVIYQRTYSTYLSHQQALLAAEELRRSEGRNLVAENAASMGRLAAAVSHELNSPLGAVRSSAESLRLLTGRLLTAEPSDKERLGSLAAKLCDILSSSATRMSEIVARVQRVSNLDRAEVQSVDLNQLVTDVAALIVGQHDGGVRIETQFADLPPVRCSPQPLGAALSGLLSRAAKSAGPTGSIRIATERHASSVDIVVVSSAPLAAPEDLGHLFDPKFQVSSGRVATADWSMLGARRLILEQGGDVRSRGKDHEVRITLPLNKTRA